MHRRIEEFTNGAMKMIIENNRIIECTEQELMEYYLTRGYDDIMSFCEFKLGFKDDGCVIME